MTILSSEERFRMAVGSLLFRVAELEELCERRLDRIEELKKREEAALGDKRE